MKIKRFPALLVVFGLILSLSTQSFPSSPQTISGQKSSAPEKETGTSPATVAGPEIRKNESGSKTTWIIIAVAAVAVLGIAALLLLKKKTASSPSTPPPPPPIVPDTGTLDVRSTPAGARIYLDGADAGKTTNALLTDIPVGAHSVRLALARYQESSASVDVLKNQTTLMNAALKPGSFTETFDSGQAAYWETVRGTWAVQSNAYYVTAAPPVNFACSQYAFADFGDFTLEVKCLITRPDGGSGRGHGILFRGSRDLGRYYIFHVNPGSQVAGGPMWDVFEITNDQISRQYDPWTHTNAINDGWNTIKLVAQGNQFSFYANGVYLGARTISEAPAAGRIGLGCEVDINGSNARFDDVVLSVPAGAEKSRLPRN